MFGPYLPSLKATVTLAWLCSGSFLPFDCTATSGPLGAEHRLVWKQAVALEARVARERKRIVRWVCGG